MPPSRASGKGAAIVIVEQDIAQALQVADRVYCMMEGRVTLEGRRQSSTAPISMRPISERKPMNWLDTILQGILLGGLLRPLRGGSVAGLRHHAARQSRPWRPDRLFGLPDPAAGLDTGPQSIPGGLIAGR